MQLDHSTCHVALVSQSSEDLATTEFLPSHEPYLSIARLACVSIFLKLQLIFFLMLPPWVLTGRWPQQGVLAELNSPTTLFGANCWCNCGDGRSSSGGNS